jgi:hypothetical protein
MNFPGRNSVSEDAIIEAVTSQITILQQPNVRVISCRLESYPTRVKVEFTTDPEPQKDGQ